MQTQAKRFLQPHTSQENPLFEGRGDGGGRTRDLDLTVSCGYEV